MEVKIGSMDDDLRYPEVYEPLRTLAAMVASAIRESMRCFLERDLEGAKSVIEGDDAIDILAKEIEERCVQIIATQQPVARDVREVVAELHINTELERIGDYAEGIAKLTLLMPGEMASPPGPTFKTKVVLMQEQALDMLEQSMASFFSRNVAQAEKVLSLDEIVNKLYRQAEGAAFRWAGREETLEAALTSKVAALLRSVAHNLERLADRSKNIAEQTIFFVGSRGEGTEVVDPSEQ